MTPTPDPLREHEQALLALGRYMLNVEPAKADWSLVGTLAADVVNGLPAVRAALAQPAPALDVERLRRIEAAAEALIWDLDHGHPTTAILRAEQRLRAALAEPQS